MAASPSLPSKIDAPPIGIEESSAAERPSAQEENRLFEEAALGSVPEIGTEPKRF